MPKIIEIRKPDDFHAHLRSRDLNLLKNVALFTAKYFRRALVMPNTIPSILTGYDAVRYYWEIKKALEKDGLDLDFTPLLTIKLTDETTPQIICEARNLGVVAAKLYPRGATTNSQDGVSDVEKLGAVFEEMQKVGMVLSIHGEMPGMPSDDAEYEFLKGPFWWIYLNFEELKIVWEHITTADIANLLVRYPDRVAGTITAHHLVLNRDDVMGNPHNYCRPPAKRPEDREALIRAATSGNSKFFFGSDSAPHWETQKFYGGSAGVFSAPVALPVLAQVFEKTNALDRLEDFTSRFGAEFYGLPLNTEKIKLVKRSWMPNFFLEGAVDERTKGKLVLFKAGQLLNWALEK